ncbi:MAG TPA: adenosine kinase [Miltoncostaeaceae bacterium]|nr:adenosine kinase [Miltoncostaeaceae bacterium]
MADSGSLDILGIGNAIVDVLAHTDDAALEAESLVKGTMALIDAPEADRLYRNLGPAIEVSGGSCANTIAGAASLGSTTAYIGRVRDDDLGRIFTHDIRATGVHFSTEPATDGPGTARCLVMVTPDAQRTMCTYLGASVGLSPSDIDAPLVRAADITYLEGYLWDPPEAKEAFRAAIAIAKDAGRRVALTLSDPFCVERHRDEFRELVDHGIDILFANQDEITALYETDDLNRALAAVRGRCPIVVVTRSEKGSVVLTADEHHEVSAAPVDRVVDTTGAGDLYAAGFLHGLTSGRSLPECAAIGGLAAAEVISHMGARPETDLARLVVDAQVAR